MEQRPNWKFGNNFYSAEDFGVEQRGYLFTDGLHSRFVNAFVGRLKKLISSGIYGLWDKWDRIRFSQSGIKAESKKLTDEIHQPTPLSLENSGTPYILRGYVLGLIVAFGVLQIEFIYQLLQKYKRKRTIGNCKMC